MRTQSDVAARGLAALSACASVACGAAESEPGSAECPVLAACGGVVEGVWRVRSSCAQLDIGPAFESTGLPVECQDGLQLEGVEVSGGASFTGPYYSEELIITLDWGMEFDLSCVSALAEAPVSAPDLPEFCAAFSSELSSSPQNPFSSVSCAALETTCRCHVVQDQQVSSTGTFQTDAGRLELGSATARSYCVAGDELGMELPVPMLGTLQLTYVRTPP